MVFFKSIKKTLFVISVVYIFIGGLLIADKGVNLDYIVMIFSAGIGFVGIFNMLRYLFVPIDERYKRNDFVFGAVILALALYLYKETYLITTSINIVFGFAICISGFVTIQDLFDAKVLGRHRSGVYFISAAICFVLGVLVLIMPAAINAFDHIFMGIGLLYCGISDLISNFYLAVARSKYESNIRKQKEAEEEKQKEIDMEADKKFKEELKERLKQDAKKELLEEAEMAAKQIEEKEKVEEGIIDKIDVPKA